MSRAAAAAEVTALRNVRNMKICPSPLQYLSPNIASESSGTLSSSAVALITSTLGRQISSINPMIYVKLSHISFTGP